MTTFMAPFEEFAHDLHSALTHLYDPRYQPPILLCTVLGIDARSGSAVIQQQVIASIALLQPSVDTPPTARSRRFHALLTARYTQELTQEETAQQLGITPRHLRREQQQAIQALAQRLWERWQAAQIAQPKSAGILAAAADQVAGQAPVRADDAWRNQLHQELALLQQHVPGAVTELAEAFAGIRAMGNELAMRHKAILEIEPPTPSLLASIHPSALRQIVLTAIEKLCQLFSTPLATGQIRLNAVCDDQQIKLVIAGTPVDQPQHIESDLIHEIVHLQRGRVFIEQRDQQITFHVWLPKAEKAQVLVIDDNDDLVHFYRRYTAQTRYELTQWAEGDDLPATVQRLQPAIIVLDVMLPDVDGWELLRQLRADPATQQTPIIVCSVVRRAELAMTLGASHYLTKPVGRHDFIAALDQVYAPAVRRIGPT